MDRESSSAELVAPAGLPAGTAAIGDPLAAVRSALRGAVRWIGADALLAAGLCLTLTAIAGWGAWLAFGAAPAHGGIDPAGIVDRLGPARDALAAPFARWDSVWYVLIARFGYAPGPSAAFFPAYPALIHIVGLTGIGMLAAGVLVSTLSLLVALALLGRLTNIELGREHPDAPRLAIMAAALSPMAFFFVAVYSESLFLALSIGAFWAARRQRWALAALLGAGGAATRSAGVIVLLGLAVMFIQTPGRRWRDAGWLALVPLGIGVYMGWLWYLGLDPLAPLHAQEGWFRHFAGPFGGVTDGLRAAFDGARQLLSGQTRHVYFRPGGGDPMADAIHNLTLVGFLLAALPMLIGVARRLPPAYGAYTLGALALPLSYPVTPQPLMSLSRFLVVLFPLHMWLGLWLARHPRARLPWLTASGALMALGAGMFATWHWVA